MSFYGSLMRFLYKIQNHLADAEQSFHSNNDEPKVIDGDEVTDDELDSIMENHRISGEFDIKKP